MYGVCVTTFQGSIQSTHTFFISILLSQLLVHVICRILRSCLQSHTVGRNVQSLSTKLHFCVQMKPTTFDSQLLTLFYLKNSLQACSPVKGWAKCIHALTWSGTQSFKGQFPQKIACILLQCTAMQKISRGKVLCKTFLCAGMELKEAWKQGRD